MKKLIAIIPTLAVNREFVDSTDVTQLETEQSGLLTLLHESKCTYWLAPIAMANSAYRNSILAYAKRI